MYMGSASGQPGSPVLQQYRRESERTLGTLGEVRGVGEGVSGGGGGGGGVPSGRFTISYTPCAGVVNDRSRCPFPRARL